MHKTRSSNLHQWKVFILLGLACISAAFVMLFGLRLDVRFISDLNHVITSYQIRVRDSLNEPEKIILDWTSFFGSSITKENYMVDCADYRCMVATDRSYSSAADAILFHIRDFHWNDIPSVRNRSWRQRYVFMLLESPYHTGQKTLNTITGFFNWTQTYRLDSDVPLPYGYLDNSSMATEHFGKYVSLMERTNRSLQAEKDEMTGAIAGKTDAIVWFVSNCRTPSKRETYVSNLRQYIPVHTYGGCGWGNCSKQSKHCDEMLESRYWFYLAAENSVCKDYVTEKLWQRLSKWTIPIVLKRSIYDGIIPSDGFIALDDYTSPQHMAEHLYSLMNDTRAYIAYFDWKFQGHRIYISPDPWSGRDSGLCHLCQKLWQSDLPQKQYDDLDKWWFTDGDCQDDFALRLLDHRNVTGL